MKPGKSALVAGVCALLLGGAGAPSASADPLPGFEFDPVALEARMDACMEYAVPESELLMGWVNATTGDARQWRCSSLRHMILDAETRNPPVSHDPFANPADFMRCVDKVVSYGFPRRGTGAGNTNYIYQYEGTNKRADVVVNDATGDIATIYTTPNNDWTGCANGL